MKKWLTVIAVVVLSLALVIGIACGGGDEDEEGVTELKYGVGLPLTGVYGAIVGTATKYSMEIAADDIGVFEVGGKQYRWKIVLEDNLLTVEGGHNSATKLIYEHNVDIMGQATDAPAAAAAMITEEIPMILEVLSGSITYIGPDFPHTFVSLIAWEVTIPAFVDWLAKEHPEVKVLAMATEETPSGEATSEIWRMACEYHGIEFHEVIAPPNTVEWYPVATKMMTHDPDVATGGPGTDLFQPMWDMGYDGFCASQWWDEAMAKAAGWDKIAEKNRFGKGLIVYALHPYAGVFPRLEAFADEYERRSGMEMGPSAAWIMNNLYYLTDALQQAGTVDDVEKIVDALEGGTFDTLVGQMYFGLEEVIGIPHAAVWPMPIFEIVGESEYLVHKVYTAEEAEAALLEVHRGR